MVQVQNWLNLRYELNRVGRRILTLCELKLLDEDLSRLKTWYQTMVKKKKKLESAKQELFDTK